MTNVQPAVVVEYESSGKVDAKGHQTFTVYRLVVVNGQRVVHRYPHHEDVDAFIRREREAGRWVVQRGKA